MLSTLLGEGYTSAIVSNAYISLWGIFASIFLHVLMNERASRKYRVARMFLSVVGNNGH
jgi:drug/metabolite transporter (DMT)-like permease